MKSYLVVPFLTVLLFCQCTSERKETVKGDAAPVSEESGKIYISYSGGDNHSTLTYNDHFGEEYTLVLEQAKRIITLEPENFLLLKDVDHKSQVTYILLPGDTLEYTKGSSEKIGYFVGSDAGRNKELAIFPQMAAALGTLSSPFIDLALLKKLNSSSAKLDSVIEKQYADSKSFLNAYAKEYAIRPEVKAIADNVLTYDFYKNRIILANMGATPELRKQILSSSQQLLNSADAAAYDYHDFRVVSNSTIAALSSKEKDPAKNLELRYKLYEKQAKPELAELLQFFLLTNATAQKQPTYQALLNDFQARSETVPIKEYLASQQRLVELRKTIDYDVTLLDEAENPSDLQVLLKQYKGQLVYVDLWASWCRPCLAEMPASRALQQEYAGKKVVFLYLSLDENKNSWLKALASQKDVMSSQNSYLLLDNFKSTFAQKYNVKAIPHYLLIDKSGNVVDANAPRPSEAESRALIDKYLMN